MYMTGEWGHFNKKDERGQTCGLRVIILGWRWMNAYQRNSILLSLPILSNCRFSFHMYSLNRLGNFFWDPKWMIDDPEIIKDWTWRLTFNLDQLFLGISANVTQGNLTVVYELDISQSPLLLDECCPLYWMPISLCVHNTVQL